MAELIDHILTLPRVEQLRLVAAVIAHLEEAEQQKPFSHLPAWQAQLAAEALAELKEEETRALSDETFWREVDLHIEGLEGK